jgi:hypothetical protein
MIYKKLTAYDLRREFERFDRDYYSIEAYEKMIEIFDDTPFELDVIGLCCSFAEFTPEEFFDDWEMILGKDIFHDYQAEYYEENEIENPTLEEINDSEDYAMELIKLDLLDEARRSQTVEELANGNYLIF